MFHQANLMQLKISFQYLIASNNMDDDKHVSHDNEPCRFVQRDENVVLHCISKHSVSNKSNREVTESHNYVSNNNSPPHTVMTTTTAIQKPNSCHSQE